MAWVAPVGATRPCHDGCGRGTPWSLTRRRSSASRVVEHGGRAAAGQDPVGRRVLDRPAARGRRRRRRRGCGRRSGRAAQEPVHGDAVRLRGADDVGRGRGRHGDLHRVRVLRRAADAAVRLRHLLAAHRVLLPADADQPGGAGGLPRHHRVQLPGPHQGRLGRGGGLRPGQRRRRAGVADREPRRFPRAHPGGRTHPAGGLAPRHPWAASPVAASGGSERPCGPRNPPRRGDPAAR